MFNVILLIDCDSCRLAFSRATVSSLRYPPQVWQSAIEEMKQEASFQGWYFNETCSLCEECIEEEQYRARQMQGEQEA